jgi:hypothetical protein
MTFKELAYYIGLNNDSQGDDGSLYIILELLSRCVSEGYTPPSVGNNEVTTLIAALRDITGTTMGNCHSIDTLERRVNRYREMLVEQGRQS